MSASRLRQLPGLIHALTASRRYADLPPMTRSGYILHRLRRTLREIAALPRELRNAPPLPKDSGAGHIVRREHSTWVIRPVTGWRAHFGPPLHSNKQLGPDDHDAACDWAIETLHTAH